MEQFSRRDVLQMSAAAGLITAASAALLSSARSDAATDPQVLPGGESAPLTPPAS
jgi:hypothetical protein